jgi:hypothetical protein
MAHVAQIDLKDYRHRITQDVKNLFEKYHTLVEGILPEMDGDLADAFILLEIRTILKNIQDDKLEKIIN